MIFDDEDISGRKLFSQRRNLRKRQVLDVKATSKRGAGGVPRRAVFVLVPVALVAFLAMLGFLAFKAGGWLFSENDRFVIRSVNIMVGQGATISEAKIAEWAKIEVGMNLFAFSIKDVRARILKHAWNIESLQIRRYLPDRIDIEVVERSPVARLGRNGVYGIDRQGYVFVLRSRKVLPVLEGYGGSNVKPGDRLEGMVQAALAVLEVCDNPAHNISIRAIDVSGDGHLVLYVSNDKHSPLSWPGMGERTPESRAALMVRIRRLALAMRSSRSAPLPVLDATYGDRIFGRRD